MLYGDLLIFSCDGSDDGVRRRRSTSGPARCAGRRRGASRADQAYSTPLVIRVGDRDQLVSVGAYRAAAYDPQTGKEIWRVSYADGFSNVPRPVFGHGLVYIATGFQQPSLLAVRAGRHRRRHQDARRLDAEARRAADAVAAARRRRALRRQRRRHRVVPRCEDRRDALAAAARRRLLRVAGVRRRTDLLPERGRRRDRASRRERVSQAGDEHARRRDARVDGGVGAARSSSAPTATCTGSPNGSRRHRAATGLTPARRWPTLEPHGLGRDARRSSPASTRPADNEPALERHRTSLRIFSANRPRRLTSSRCSTPASSGRVAFTPLLFESRITRSCSAVAISAWASGPDRDQRRAPCGQAIGTPYLPTYRFRGARIADLVVVLGVEIDQRDERSSLVRADRADCDTAATSHPAGSSTVLRSPCSVRSKTRSPFVDLVGRILAACR